MRVFQKTAAMLSVLLSRYLEETEVRGGAEMDTITQAVAHASRQHPEIHNRSTGGLRSADARAAVFFLRAATWSSERSMISSERRIPFGGDF